MRWSWKGSLPRFDRTTTRHSSLKDAPVSFATASPPIERFRNLKRFALVSVFPAILRCTDEPAQQTVQSGGSRGRDMDANANSRLVFNIYDESYREETCPDGRRPRLRRS